MILYREAIFIQNDIAQDTQEGTSVSNVNAILLVPFNVKLSIQAIIKRATTSIANNDFGKISRMDVLNKLPLEVNAELLIRKVSIDRSLQYTRDVCVDVLQSV